MSAVPFVTDQPAAKVHASLFRSLQAVENAQQCAVLWFADIMRRHLYRELGYSSVNQYAMQELGFSKSRTRDFIRLVGRLDKLPAVKEAVISGELGYTRAPGGPSPAGLRCRSMFTKKKVGLPFRRRRRTRTQPGRIRTHEVRRRGQSARPPQHDDHSTANQEGSPGPGYPPLPGPGL